MGKEGEEDVEEQTVLTELGDRLGMEVKGGHFWLSGWFYWMTSPLKWEPRKKTRLGVLVGMGNDESLNSLSLGTFKNAKRTNLPVV